MAFLYHTTKLSNVKSIMEEGLKAKVPSQRPNHPKGVYLSEYMLNWMKNTTIDGSNGAVLKIDITGLWLVRDKHSKEEELQSIQKDYICLSDIPPSRIMEVLAETSRGHLQHIYAGTSATRQEAKPIKANRLKDKRRFA